MRSSTLVALLPGMLTVAGCQNGPPQAGGGTLEGPLHVEEQRIQAADGASLLTIEELPASIRVDDASEFGAAEAFTDAELSPDGQWLAIATLGAAHGAGWLMPRKDTTPHPATFQYGGEVTLGPWSPDGRYATFLNDSPASSRLLVVVDRAALNATVGATESQVRIPSHAQQVPPHAEYEIVEWRDGKLVFEVEGQRFRYEPSGGEVIPDGP
jgi:dipeptidyl aminopeptidase/acylaminoacyl peptidase